MVLVRAAGPADYTPFTGLFPELAVDDPTPDRDRFERDLLPTTIVADEAGAVVGYAYFQVLGDLTYIRHIVVAKAARRGGVGRKLMEAVRERALAARCARWCLNVKPDNAAAIALYERCGMTKGHRTHALRIEWQSVNVLPATDDALRAVPIAPSDDAAVERETGVVPGFLADARARVGRVLLRVVDAHDRNVGAAVFDTGFPGAFPFKAASPDAAFALLRAMRPHARQEDAIVNFVVEDQKAIADALLAHGATLRLEVMHMKGALTDA